MGTVLHQFSAIFDHDSVLTPVRVYQGKSLGVFTAEIQFPSGDIHVANTVLDWFIKESLIINSNRWSS